MVDQTHYDSTLYDLCSKCHSEQSLRDVDSFNHHKEHFEGATTPCNTCHDPHGISNTQGNAVNNSHLINFELSIVDPVWDQDTGTFRLEFIDLGDRTGECWLECHSKKHDPKDYKP